MGPNFMPIPAPFTRSQSGAAGITFRTDRERPRILSGYVLVLSVFAGLVNALYWSGRQQPDDWSSLWIAGILVNNGNSDHIYDFDPTDFAAWSGSAWQEVIVTNDLSAAPHPFVHIPGVAYAVAPFTDVLSFEASVVWLTALCGACLPLLVSASWALWSRTTVPLPALLAITVAAWYATAFQSGMWLGQTTPIILCMTVCGIAYARDRPVAAGIVLGLAGIVKLTPLGLIPLMLLFRHYRRGAATATATAAFVALASLVVGGGGLFGTWIDRMRWLSAHVVVTGSNRSFASAVLRDKPDNGGVAPVVDDVPLWVSVIPILVAVVLFAAIVWAAWRQRRWAAPLVLMGAYAIATMASSLLWNHYLLVCVPLVIGIAVFSQHFETRLRTVFMVLSVVALLLLYPPLNEQVGAAQAEDGLALPWAGFTALVVFIGLLAASAAALPRAQRGSPPGPGSTAETEHQSSGRHAKSTS
ncbi:glycosyltransferase family 87 protein [Corynebacterium variabile]|uniref:DUF2029 domain-containing protein n=2 Tax=Corynebacteriaceae TaxID=1653 RepID=A0ABN4CBB0_9CORY|nr:MULTISPECIES: glycosyltransferase family 87 protein [Actinomycetes]AHI18643.1 hypothetical protein CCASEI_00290 [Corynebacterium casei LMG S-19264]MDN5807884.1 DUF2029 domain-containing protein [Brevibacterium sp.]SLM93247.1 hypothetical protein CZ765_11150 [Corynebacterium casei]MDN6513299.1 DUF2029 domain-containing protein [Acidipropionibacterium jensenii]MDN6823271.1 DUF2029 domain-containing protein [Corynebacterium flavescens]